MKSIFYFAPLGMCAFLAGSLAWAQATQQPAQQGSTQNQKTTGQGQSGTTQNQTQNQKTTGQGQSGTTQNQNTTSGSKSTTGQNNSTISGQQGNSSRFNQIGQSPWFGNQDIRQQLKLNDQQYNSLNQAYQQSYNQYQQGMSNLGKDLTEQQRAEREREMRNNFNKSYSSSVEKYITDPEQRRRYNQMYYQYQGYGAFEDPMVQEKLNLTSEQRQKLGQYGQEWNKQMGEFGRTYQTDREGSMGRWTTMRKGYDERINSVLTPEQRQTWRTLSGEPYNFQPNIYFQTTTSGSGSGTTTNPRNR